MEPLPLHQVDPGRPDDVERFYAELDRLRSDGHAVGGLRLGLSGLAFVGPDVLVALVTGARLWHRWTGGRVTLVGMRRDVHQYLERMDLFSVCGEWIAPEAELDPRERWGRSRASRKLLEVMPIAPDPEENARDVGDAYRRAHRIVTSWFDRQEDEVGRILTVLTEITSNVVHSRDRGFAAIQHHRSPSGPASGGRVTVAVADLGVGIEASLRARSGGGTGLARPLGSGMDAILQAFELGVSSRGTVAGLGLARVREIVEAWDGVLRVRSDRAAVRIDAGGVHAETGLVDVPGTQVTITVRDTPPHPGRP